VLEIVLGIVLGIMIGPSGLGWVKPDAPVTVLALVGLAFPHDARAHRRS